MLLLLAILGLLQVNAYSQQAKTEVVGVVKDNQGDPLPGVSVRVKEGANGAVTDIQGRYTLEVPSADATLVFSYIGFDALERKVGSNSVLNVTLKPSTKQLDEVVIVGYGEALRRDITGAIGSVKMEDMQKAPVRSFEESLAGRVAGVQVSSQDGQPGSNISIVIRGANSITQSNSPLYVIDGFPIEDPENNALNPDDIESIEVLKDASATAIYGARGANGVIIVTTKRGQEGTPTITYNGSYGMQKIIQRMEVMSPYEFIKYNLEKQPSTTRTLYLSDGRELESYRDVKGIDWQDKLFQTAGIQNHTLSLQGGTKQTRYTLSGNIFKQDGVVVSSNYDRVQGRMRLEQQVNDRFTVSANLNYSHLYTSGGTPIPADGTSVHTSALMYSVWGYRPVSGKEDDTALEEQGLDEEIDWINDYRWHPINNYVNSKRESTTNVLTVNGYGEYRWNNFRLKISGGLTRQVGRNESFNDTNTRSGNYLTSAGRGPNGSASYAEMSSYLNENILTYNKTLKRHKITVLGGFTLQERTTRGIGASAYTIPNEALGINGLDEGIANTVSSYESASTMASFLGRANYDYRGKYLATFSFRSDGSSKFPPQNKWSYFPSGALSWRFSKEKFMKSLAFVEDGKLRVSTGITGNNRVPDFAYMSSLAINNAAIYPFGNANAKGLVPAVLGNDKLLWENTLQTDLGLDLSLFKDKVNLTVDVYRKNTYDLLLNADLPPSLGFGQVYKNIGEVQNQGLEISLGTTNFKTTHFTWSSDFNISFNRGKVMGLTQGQEVLTSAAGWNNFYPMPLWRAKVGEPIGMFYGLIWEGNYQYEHFDQLPTGAYVLKSHVPTNGEDRADIQPGDIKYRDINGDGVANLDDYTIIGNPNPDYIGGLSNNFRYKGLDLNVFFQYSVGNDVYNNNRTIFEGAGRSQQNMFATYVNRWTPENQNNEYYRTGGEGPYAYSSRVVEDGSFIRLKTVSLGYNLPKVWLNKLKIQRLRVHVSSQNLYTWTKYQGFDPEVSIYAGALRPGFDWSVYPRARTLTFGLNLTL
ncbi:MAG: SusC/RagA family TonB-linked outer membrane protein [Adhaeribacter sp.]